MKKALAEKTSHMPETNNERESMEQEIHEANIKYDISFEHLVRENIFFLYYCTYKTKKKSGLKIHVGRMHTTRCFFNVIRPSEGRPLYNNAKKKNSVT